MLGITLDDIARVEQVLGFSFPLAHRQDLERRDSEIREACEFLLVDSTEHRDLLRKNVWLRQNYSQGWTPSYIAFASHGCGDYFAYDLNFEPYRIIYVRSIRDARGNLQRTVHRQCSFLDLRRVEGRCNSHA